MKKTILSILLTYFGYQVGAQNLIPNSSFDSLTKCPNRLTWLNNEILIPPWFRATSYSTPDNYNECSTEPMMSVPYNNQGFTRRPAHSGSGYAGIFVRPYGRDPDGSREYIETPLIKPLEKDQTYFVRFYIAQRGDTRYRGEMVYINSIGLNFTDTPFYTDTYIAKLTPSVEHKGAVIKDTINWTPICGVYKAKGGEKYATIGNFRSDAETTIEKEDTTNNPYTNPTYYFLDDALVVLYNPLPDSIIICNNKPITLNASFLNGKYKWNTGSTDSVITVDKAGVYLVETTIDGCVLTDMVSVIDPRINDAPLSDTSICKGQIVTLSSKMRGKYLWSTGSKEANIQVNTEGVYSVTVSNVCGDFSSKSTVKLGKCDCNVFVPNAFSPNGDGFNDEFQPFMDCDIPMKIKRFQIFNRWGSLIFKRENTNDVRWDGKVNGSPVVDTGVFVWYMEYEIERNGKMETRVEYGDFTIVL
jgi:gliding motility-associated-like protein